MADDFDRLLGWIDDHLGRRVTASLSGPVNGLTNTSIHATGTLMRKEDEINLIDPRPGRVVGLGVGDATLILLEGDLVDVDLEHPIGLVSADFDEFTLTLMARD